MVLFFVLTLINARASAEDFFLNHRDIKESERIKKFSSKVKREDGALYLRLKSGSYIKLANSKDCDSNPDACRVYEFIDYIIDRGFYVINEGYYEGDEYLMISDKTGKEFVVHEYPHIPPEGNRFVTVSASEAYDVNGVFVRRFEGDVIMPEFAYEPKEYALYEFAGWKDKDTIQLIKLTNSDKEYCPETDFMTVPVRLISDKKGWGFYEELSPGKVRCVPDK